MLLERSVQRMELSGEYTFDGPRDTVWAYLQDPNVLTRVLPGCEELKEIGENSYEGALKVKIGPIQGKFQGKIQLLNIVAPEGYDVDVSGQGAPGFVRGSGGLRLDTHGDRTHMTYQGQAQIGGRIANVGQRLVESSARAIIKQSLDALNELIKLAASPQSDAAATLPDTGDANDASASAVSGTADSRIDSPQASAAAPEPEQAPSSPAIDSPQATPPVTPRPVVAAIPPGFTPDVTRDMVPERYVPVVAGAAGGALVLALYLLLKQLFGARD
jgi:uncharacterized protein